MDSIENNRVFSNNQIDIDGLPDYRTVALIAVSVGNLYKDLIQVAIFAVLVIVANIFIHFEPVEQLFLNLFLIVSILIICFMVFNAIQINKSYGYALREQDLVFQRGYLVQKTTVIPFNRIQHVSTSRSVLDKMFGISSLKIFTAGGQGSDIRIPGLTPQLAKNLKEGITDKVSAVKNVG